MLTSMMCVQTQGGGGKLEFDVEPVQWNDGPMFFWGADTNHGTITPTGFLKGICWRRHVQMHLEDTMCTFSKPIFDGKCDIITELNEIGSSSTTVEWTRDTIDKTRFSCPLSAVGGPFDKPFHMTVYPKK